TPQLCVRPAYFCESVRKLHVEDRRGVPLLSCVPGPRATRAVGPSRPQACRDQGHSNAGAGTAALVPSSSTTAARVTTSRVMSPPAPARFEIGTARVAAEEPRGRTTDRWPAAH